MVGQEEKEEEEEAAAAEKITQRTRGKEHTKE